LVLTVFLAVSCQEKGYLDGGGVNPLDKCVISESVLPGMESVVQWNGFDASASLYLRGEDGKVYGAEVTVVTASGLIFRVPEGLVAGKYTVIVEQSGGRQELGTIEILEAELPVTGLKIPSVVEPGKQFAIEGAGFDADHIISLVRDGESVVLKHETVSSGVEVMIPQSVKCGEYSLYLSAGTDKWLLSDHLSVAVRKKLYSVSKDVKYDGDVRRVTGYWVEYEEDEVEAIKFKAVLVAPESGLVEEAFDRYVLGTDGVFRAEGGSSSSLNINFGYNSNADGYVSSADVLRFSRNNPDGTMRTFSYVYDDFGRPEKVTYVLNDVTRSLQVYFYEGDNLVETMNSVFAYEDETLKNNPFGVDVAMGYDMMGMTDEPFLFFPYLIGEHPHTSSHLPSAVLEPTGMMGALEKKSLTYEFDDDGYVVKMSWEAGESLMLFDYE